MSFPAGAVKLVFAGTLSGGEKFAHTFWVDNGAAPDQSTLGLILQQAVLTFNAQIGVAAVKALFPTSTSYLTCTAYSYAGGPNADLVAGPTALAAWVGAGANALPNQCSFVLSLRTPQPGRSFRGRSFLPGPHAGTLSAAGQLSAGTVNTVGNAWKAWMQGVAAGGAGFPATPVIVASATRSLKTHVTHFGIDTRLDVQRRRADKQAVTSNTDFVL